VKRQENVLLLPNEPSTNQRQPLPAVVRSIGKIMPEVLNRYGLSLDELDECQPQLPARMFVTYLPHSHAMLEPVAAVSS
jgi:hypothetical protein